MTERARLLSQFRLEEADRDLEVTWDGNTVTVTIDSGEGTQSYWMAGDDETTDAAKRDFLKVLKDALDAAFATTFTIEVYGVQVDGLPTIADGRTKITAAAADFTLDFSHANTTLPGRILGFVDGASYTSASSVLTSPHVHRFGWYPHVYASERLQFPVFNRTAWFSAGGYPYPRKLPGWDELPLAFKDVPAVRMRPEALADAAYMPGQYGLATADPDATWAQFWSDVGDGAVDPEPDLAAPTLYRRVRFYPDASDVDYYTGPWIITGGSPLWDRPLDPPSRPERPEGETWAAVGQLRSDPGSGLDAPGGGGGAQAPLLITLDPDKYLVDGALDTGENAIDLSQYTDLSATGLLVDDLVFGYTGGQNTSINDRDARLIRGSGGPYEGLAKAISQHSLSGRDYTHHWMHKIAGAVGTSLYRGWDAAATGGGQDVFATYAIRNLGSMLITLDPSKKVLSGGTATSDTAVTLSQYTDLSATGLQTGDLVFYRVVGENQNLTWRAIQTVRGSGGSPESYTGAISRDTSPLGQAHWRTGMGCHIVGASIDASLYYRWTGAVSGSGADIHLLYAIRPSAPVSVVTLDNTKKFVADGKATVKTALDLSQHTDLTPSGVLAGDLLFCRWRGYHPVSGAKDMWLERVDDKNELYHWPIGRDSYSMEWGDGIFAHKVESSLGASLYYRWSAAPNTGLDVLPLYAIRGLTT